MHENRSDSEYSRLRHEYDASSTVDAVSVSTGPVEHTFPSHILSNDHIFDRILDHASPGTLVCLSKTCRYAHNAVDYYIPRAFNINTALSRYFKNHVAFRSLQAATLTLISGSFALQFLGRLHYPGSDLDLYCDYKSRVALGEFLLNEGYAFAPSSSQAPVFHLEAEQSDPDDVVWTPYVYPAGSQYIYAVYTFTKPIAENSDEELKVQIIVARNTPMDVILHFHSTCVMNVIAYDRAYSLYPRATFEEHINLCCAPCMESAVSAIQKYRARGFEVVYDLPSELGDIFPRSFSRWIGDSSAWSIPLSLEGVTPPPPPSRTSQPLPTDPCYFTTWELNRHRPTTDSKNDASTDKRPALYVACDILATEILAHRYAITRAGIECVVQTIRNRHISGIEVAEWDLQPFGREGFGEAPVAEGEPDLCLDAVLLRWCQLVLSPQGQNAWKDRN